MPDQMLDWIVSLEDGVAIAIHGPFSSPSKAVNWASHHLVDPRVWDYTYMTWGEAQRTVETGVQMRILSQSEKPR